MPDRSVRDIMSTPALTVGPEDTLQAAAELMLKKSIGCVPVVDGENRILGVLSEADLMAREATVPWAMFKAPQLFGQWLGDSGVENVYESSKDTPVKEFMRDDPVTIDADASVDKAVELMLEHKTKHLPVCEDGRVVGVLSRHDLLRLFLDAHQA